MVEVLSLTWQPRTSAAYRLQQFSAETGRSGGLCRINGDQTNDAAGDAAQFSGAGYKPWGTPGTSDSVSEAPSVRRVLLRYRSPRNASTPGGGSAAFTLFEVALSLGLVAFGVVSVLMLFPLGLKAQQLSRFQLYAAAKAEEMVEQFSGAHSDNATSDSEGTDAWEAAVGYRSQAWDLDARISSHRYGMMPVPLELARRLDSDNDEIKQILDEGGYVYYSQPLASTGTEETGQAEAPPNEAQRLLIGITCYAQQNALHSLAMKNWPYLVSYPAPPLDTVHIEHGWLPAQQLTPGTDYWHLYEFPRSGQEEKAYCWESARIPGAAIPGTDPDVQKVYDWPDPATGVHYGFFPYACGRQYMRYDPATNPGAPPPTPLGNGVNGDWPTRTAALRYLQAALWYCKKKGLPPAFWNDPHTGGIPTYEPGTADDVKWKQVQAMRFLSHAATCMTAWYPLETTGSGDDLHTKGVKVPAVTWEGVTGGSLAGSGASDPPLTNALILYYHERSLKLIMDFAATFPYDWAVPRPVQRTLMVDYPLLECDLFSPALSGTIVGSGGVTAQQWAPLSPQPIRNIGLGMTYPLNQTGSGRNKLEGTIEPGRASNLMGDLDHYNLGQPFAASERCREIVFWTADWQSYEDFETLPSAPVDASRYPIAGPRTDTSGNPHDFPTRMNDVVFVDPHLFCYRNPEKTELWFPGGGGLPADLPTGTDMSGQEILNSDTHDGGPDPIHRKTFVGLYGADRNFNKHLDRGPVPKSVRMRAAPVARFNYYDPRLPCILR